MKILVTWRQSLSGLDLQFWKPWKHDGLLLPLLVYRRRWMFRRDWSSFGICRKFEGTSCPVDLHKFKICPCEIWYWNIFETSRSCALSHAVIKFINQTILFDGNFALPKRYTCAGAVECVLPFDLFIICFYLLLSLMLNQNNQRYILLHRS